MACWASALALLAACGDDAGNDEHDSDAGAHADDEGEGHGNDDDHEHENATGAVCPSNSTLTYDNFGKAFFATYCVGCHGSDVEAADRDGAPLDHNFDSLAGIRENLEHIDSFAAAGPDAVNTEMPPSGDAPSTAEREKLGEWLACGAPE